MADNRTTIDDRVWQKLVLRLKDLDEKRVKIGVIGKSDVAEIATIHEFGAPGANIPARSFIRGTFRDRGPLTEVTAKLATRVIKGGLVIERALGLLGTWAEAQIKRTIRNRIPPPLKPATIAAKGSSVPLIDTGRLINSITWEITNNSEE